MAGIEQVRAERLEDAVLRVVRRVWSATRSGTSPYRVDKAAYGALGRLEQSGEIRLTDLAAALDLDVSTVSRHVRAVEQLGLVARRSDPTDGRASLVRLTDAGAQELARQRAARQYLLGVATADWPAEDRERLLGYMERLAADLETSAGACAAGRPAAAGHAPAADRSAAAGAPAGSAPARAAPAQAPTRTDSLTSRKALA